MADLRRSTGIPKVPARRPAHKLKAPGAIEISPTRTAACPLRNAVAAFDRALAPSAGQEISTARPRTGSSRRTPARDRRCHLPGRAARCRASRATGQPARFFRTRSGDERLELVALPQRVAIPELDQLARVPGLE